MTQLRTSCKCKFWLNKTTACFQIASCVSRVIGPDKETSSKAETVKETTIKQKEKKTHSRKTTQPPQTQRFKCCLVSLPKNKLLPMPNTFPLFSHGFLNAECLQKSYHFRSSGKFYDFSFLLCVLR